MTQKMYRCDKYLWAEHRDFFELQPVNHWNPTLEKAVSVGDIEKKKKKTYLKLQISKIQEI